MTGGSEGLAHGPTVKISSGFLRFSGPSGGAACRVYLDPIRPSFVGFPTVICLYMSLKR